MMNLEQLKSYVYQQKNADILIASKKKRLEKVLVGKMSAHDKQKHVSEITDNLSTLKTDVVKTNQKITKILKSASDEKIIEFLQMWITRLNNTTNKINSIFTEFKLH